MKPVFDLSLLKTFGRDDRGTVAIVAAGTMAVMLGAVGLGVDYGRALNQRTAMQRAMDASLLAAGATADPSQRLAVAEKYFAANYTGGTPVTPIFANAAGGKLGGTANAQVPTTISQIIGITSLNTSAAATVAPAVTVSETTTGSTQTTTQGALPCIMALDTAKRWSFWLISNSNLSAPQCEVHVASTHAEAMKYDSPSQVNFKSVEVKGGVNKVGGSTIANINVASTKVASDPFVGKIPTVPTGACTYTDFTNTTQTVSPGTYCGTTKFTGSKVTMNPGLYIFQSPKGTSGGLKVDAHTIQGHGVSFYFADNNTKLLSYSSKNKNHLHAPTTGTYAGILMFEPAGLTKRTVLIDSADEQSWTGLVYLPSIDLQLKSISKWPNQELEDMPAWPAKNSPLLAPGEQPTKPTMAVAIIVNSLFSDSLSSFQHTPFSWGSPVVYLPGQTITTLVTSTTTSVVPGTLN
jgi:Flp pilus assembly protein TadG